MTALLAFDRAATQLSFRREARDLSRSPSAIAMRLCGRRGTFVRRTRYPAMKQSDIWYVTFGPHKSDESVESKARSTRTFKSEVDAKLFAMQILSKGWTASAGTLNPHQPKQIVGPSQIESWADPGIGG